MPLQSVSLDLTRILKPFPPIIYHYFFPCLSAQWSVNLQSKRLNRWANILCWTRRSGCFGTRQLKLFTSPFPKHDGGSWISWGDFLFICIFLIFLCFFQGGDKLRYHFRDDGFRLWTALKRLILNLNRMQWTHVFCFLFFNFCRYVYGVVWRIYGSDGQVNPQHNMVPMWSNKFLLPYDQ